MLEATLQGTFKSKWTCAENVQVLIFDFSVILLLHKASDAAGKWQRIALSGLGFCWYIKWTQATSEPQLCAVLDPNLQAVLKEGTGMFYLDTARFLAA